jgi:hypothetical protein
MARELVKGSPTKKGYVLMSFGKGRKGERRYDYLHRVVARVFIGPCPPGKEVNHEDGNKGNCAVGNLRYMTHKKNIEHACRNKLMASGSRIAQSVLTLEQVKSIREEIKYFSCAALARRYGISTSGLHKIVSGVTWNTDGAFTTIDIKSRRAPSLRR